MWSQINVVSNVVVSNEQVPNEVVSNEQVPNEVVANELVSIVCTPDQTCTTSNLGICEKYVRVFVT